MDDSVLAALQRWPNVPAVYGWLSLDVRGRWRLHPAGDANLGGPGESVTSPQIIGFIGRNYASDEQGNWYFQNGPQRVYVRLDAAPFVLRLADDGGLKTHTEQPIASVGQWLLDDEGRLLADTDQGAGIVDHRELLAISEWLRDSDGNTLLDILEAPLTDGVMLQPTDASLAAAELKSIARNDIPARLGFVANPVEPLSAE